MVIPCNQADAPLKQLTGRFQLISNEMKSSQSGVWYQKLRLSNAEGDLIAYDWRPGQLTLPLSTVEVCLQLEHAQYAPVYHVQTLRALDTYEIDNGAALLPVALCPPEAQAALSWLVKFNAQLQPWPLKQFLSRVLADPNIGVPFLRSRASQNHHHNQLGGLLIHSVDVARIVALYKGRISREDLMLAVVGGLFHDLGKIMTLGDGRGRRLPGFYSHEHYTMQVLGVHLHWLRQHWQEGARALEYMFQYLAKPRGCRGYARFIGAQLAEDADRQSVALCRGRSLVDFGREFHA